MFPNVTFLDLTVKLGNEITVFQLLGFHVFLWSTEVGDGGGEQEYKLNASSLLKATGPFYIHGTHNSSIFPH